MNVNPKVCMLCPHSFGMRSWIVFPKERTLHCRLAEKIRGYRDNNPYTPMFMDKICKWSMKKKLMVNENFEVPVECPYRLEQMVSSDE